MQTQQLGQSDVRLSKIIFGGWQAGQDCWLNISDDEIVNAVSAAIELGMTSFDTAEEYGDGHSEIVLGKALQGKRRDVQILTKVRWDHLEYDQVIAACEGSLKRLQTDYLDLLQIHWPSGSFGSDIVPLDETLRAFEDLKQQGKICAVGVSNFNLSQLQDAVEICPIDSIQNCYSILFRGLNHADLLHFAQANQITCLAYSPMAQGLLSGKFQSDIQFPQGDNRRQNRLFHPDILPTSLAVIEELKQIAEDKEARLSQLALAWVTTQPNACAIAGVRNAEQVECNLLAGDIELAYEEYEQIEQIAQPILDKLGQETIQWDW
ncbi:aldo/keto reductase [Algicola sagamiensis]|uniref:aldo/keto reductase n=1 Tax=Algicola sagamiensis TaxID=163869 RepID=UPI00036A4A85|nr:aldo/keto reductase [Algicola sagamiensis]